MDPNEQDAPKPPPRMSWQDAARGSDRRPPGSMDTIDGDRDRSGAPLVLPKTIVLIGMMGAGKTTIGRRVAERLAVPFVDADREIEKAAGQTISELFEEHGEAHFRDGERRVIARLLAGPPCILAAGGGAYLDPTTRALISEQAVCLWLRADIDVLWERVRRRTHRPLLRTDNPRATLERLVAERYPVYAEADITVESEDLPKEDMAERVLESLTAYFGRDGRHRGRPPQ